MAVKTINRELIKTVEAFYEKVVDDFKEAEGIIISESKFSGIFKHKDYDRNIRKLKDCKKKCINLTGKEFGATSTDKDEQRLVKDLERARFAFVALCDAHIQLQQALKDKSEGTKVKYSEYKEVYNRMQKCRKDLNSQLNELDIDYSDAVADEEPTSGSGYLTYEDIK